MKHFWLVFLFLLGTANLYANKVDQLNTDNDVELFINSLQRTKPRQHLEVHTNDQILVAGALASVSQAKNWQKADLNNDGFTDLLVNTFSGTYKPYVIIDNGNNTFKAIPLFYTSDSEFAKITTIDNQQMVLFYTAKDIIKSSNEPGAIQSHLITTDTLIYKFNSFVDYNPTPVNKEIAGIYFKTDMCFGTCPVFSIDMDSHGHSIYIGGKFNEDEGTFKGTVSVKMRKPFFDLINYLNLDKIQNNYNVNWTDSPTCWLTIRFKNGTEKTIKDYGEQGTFGLRRLYGMFFHLKEDQLWYEQ
jgi:hypothetical protein